MEFPIFSQTYLALVGFAFLLAVGVVGAMILLHALYATIKGGIGWYTREAQVQVDIDWLNGRASDASVKIEVLTSRLEAMERSVGRLDAIHEDSTE